LFAFTAGGYGDLELIPASKNIRHRVQFYGSYSTNKLYAALEKKFAEYLKAHAPQAVSAEVCVVSPQVRRVQLIRDAVRRDSMGALSSEGHYTIDGALQAAEKGVFSYVVLDVSLSEDRDKTQRFMRAVIKNNHAVKFIYIAQSRQHLDAILDADKRISVETIIYDSKFTVYEVIRTLKLRLALQRDNINETSLRSA
jgi:hypothetical protein